MTALLFLFFCCTCAAVVVAQASDKRLNCSVDFSPFHSSVPYSKCNKRNILVLGAGYSGTGFISHVLVKNRKDIGHESVLKCGTSNWMLTFEDRVVAEFSHVFAAVRHPMAFWNSKNATEWDYVTVPRSDLAGEFLRLSRCCMCGVHCIFTPTALLCRG